MSDFHSLQNLIFSTDTQQPPQILWALCCSPLQFPSAVGVGNLEMAFLYGMVRKAMEKGKWRVLNHSSVGSLIAAGQNNRNQLPEQSKSALHPRAQVRLILGSLRVPPQESIQGALGTEGTRGKLAAPVCFPRKFILPFFWFSTTSCESAQGSESTRRCD